MCIIVRFVDCRIHATLVFNPLYIRSNCQNTHKAMAALPSFSSSMISPSSGVWSFQLRVRIYLLMMQVFLSRRIFALCLLLLHSAVTPCNGSFPCENLINWTSPRFHQEWGGKNKYALVSMSRIMYTSCSDTICTIVCLPLDGHQGPLLLTWFNFNPGMDK